MHVGWQGSHCMNRVGRILAVLKFPCPFHIGATGNGMLWGTEHKNLETVGHKSPSIAWYSFLMICYVRMFELLVFQSASKWTVLLLILTILSLCSRMYGLKIRRYCQKVHLLQSAATSTHAKRLQCIAGPPELCSRIHLTSTMVHPTPIACFMTWSQVAQICLSFSRAMPRRDKLLLVLLVMNTSTTQILYRYFSSFLYKVHQLSSADFAHF